MKSEAYLRGIRARLSELYKLGLENTECNYIDSSDEHIDWLTGRAEANKLARDTEINIKKLNESGINIKIQIEK